MEIQPVNPKGNQSWLFIGRTDAEAETPILWPPDAKNWFLGKDPDAGKDWRQEDKGKTEVEMVGWHHRLDRQECEQDLGVDGGQGSLAYCSPWGCKESDRTEQLNWTEGKGPRKKLQMGKGQPTHGSQIPKDYRLPEDLHESTELSWHWLERWKLDLGGKIKWIIVSGEE